MAVALRDVGGRVEGCSCGFPESWGGVALGMWAAGLGCPSSACVGVRRACRVGCGCSIGDTMKFARD